MSGWIQACFKSVPTSVPQPFIWGGLHSFPLRQKSSLQMNRKISWDQQPPNMDDYGSECFEKAGVFQLMPRQSPAVEENVKSKDTPKRFKVESGNHVVAPSTKTPPRTQCQPTGGDSNVSCFFVWSQKGVGLSSLVLVPIPLKSHLSSPFLFLVSSHPLKVMVMNLSKVMMVKLNN